ELSTKSPEPSELNVSLRLNILQQRGITNGRTFQVRPLNENSEDGISLITDFVREPPKIPAPQHPGHS
ncbi:2742_t:CDS:2, partial [Ambispora leptoticha]